MKPLIIGLIAIHTMACATAPKQPCKTIAAIRAEYRYPLTNTQTYFDWLRMGNFGPSPQAWCKGYAQRKVRATSRSG